MRRVVFLSGRSIWPALALAVSFFGGAATAQRDTGPETPEPRFADRVLFFEPDYLRGRVSTDPDWTAPSAALGPPTQSVGGYVALGGGGRLAVGFTRVWIACSGDGRPDLTISKARDRKACDVFVKPADRSTESALIAAEYLGDAAGWFRVGRAADEVEPFDLDSCFTRAAGCSLRFRGVRLDDANPRDGDALAGAAIDAVAALSWVEAEHQLDSAEASLRVFGESDDTWPRAIEVNVNEARRLHVEVRAAPFTPFMILFSPAGLVEHAGLPMDGGIVDLDPRDGIRVILDGIHRSGGTRFDPDAVTDEFGTWSFSVPLPEIDPSSVTDPRAHLGAIQVAVRDPLRPRSVILTGAADMTLVAARPRAGIFVARLDDVDRADGSPQRPFPSVTEGLAAARASHATQLWVAAGVYHESPVFPDGVSVHGGLNPEDWHPVAGAWSTFAVGSVPAQVERCTMPTLVEWLEFFAETPIRPGRNSTALEINQSTPALEFRDCRFFADRGADGADGVVRPDVPGSFGGDGGRGGSRLNEAGHRGLSGELGATGGAGGAASAMGSGSPGHDGSAGALVRPGRNGERAPDGTLSETGWITGAGGDGTDGDAGRGGGGGGGGGAGAAPGPRNRRITVPGGAGGAGGRGGDGGGAGIGGLGGGGSFAVTLINASPVFCGCTFRAQRGGAGGAGADGHPGTDGFAGIAGVPGASFGGVTGGTGGAGGRGTRGGAGGGGGGGNGGPSYCVLRAGISIPTLIRCGNHFVTDFGGAGGRGGTHGSGLSTAPAGVDGVAASTN